MNVANFFRFIAEKKPKEYPLNQWGPQIMKKVIKHLKPVPGQSSIDYDNLNVSGKFESVYKDNHYSEHAEFNDDGKLLKSYAECDIHTYGGMGVACGLYLNALQNIKDKEIRRSVLWRAFYVLSKNSEIVLEKDFEFNDWDGELFSVNSVSFHREPVLLYNFLKSQFSKLTDDEINFIKETDNLDIKRFLESDRRGYVFLEILSSVNHNRGGYPEFMGRLHDYVLNMFHCCAQYEADDLNSEWFTGMGPKSVDSENNIKKVDLSRFPIVKWILSGNEYVPYYSDNKQLKTPADVIDGYKVKSFSTKGLDVDLISHYMEKYPFQS